MSKRTLSYAVLAGLLVLGVAWSIGQVESLRKEVAQQGARIAALERQ